MNDDDAHVFNGLAGDRPKVNEGERFKTKNVESLGALQAVPEIEGCHCCIANGRGSVCQLMPACFNEQLIFVPVDRLNEYRAARVAFKLTGETPE